MKENGRFSDSENPESRLRSEGYVPVEVGSGASGVDFVVAAKDTVVEPKTIWVQSQKDRISSDDMETAAKLPLAEAEAVLAGIATQHPQLLQQEGRDTGFFVNGDDDGGYFRSVAHVGERPSVAPTTDLQTPITWTPLAIKE